MSRYLLVREEQYRVDLEGEVEILLEEFKDNCAGELVNYSSTKKTTKDDEYYIVKVKVKYNDAKNPVDAFAENRDKSIGNTAVEQEF